MLVAVVVAVVVVVVGIAGVAVAFGPNLALCMLF